MRYRAIFFISILMVIVLASFMMASKNIPQPQYDMTSERAVGKFLSRMAKELQKRHDILPIANIIGMPGGVIDLLGLKFQAYRPLDQDEIRKILVDCAEFFLAEENKEESFRASLKEYPVSMKHIEIGLFISGKNGEDLDDPYISCAGVIHGEIDYSKMKRHPVEGHLMITRSIEESYREALKIIKDQKSQ